MYFENVIVVFSSLYVTSLFDSAIKVLSSEIAKRNLINKIEVNNFFTMASVEFQKEQKFIFPVGEKIYSVLKNESPFKIHFKSIIETNLKSVHRNDSVDVDKKKMFSFRHYFWILFMIIYIYCHYGLV